jgi:hypothetical protein
MWLCCGHDQRHVSDLTAQLADERKAREEAVDVLRANEWEGGNIEASDGEWYGTCPECGHSKYRGHAADCRLAALIPPTPTEPVTPGE